MIAQGHLNSYENDRTAVSCETYVSNHSERGRGIPLCGRDEPASPELSFRHASRIETPGSLADLGRCKFCHVIGNTHLHGGGHQRIAPDVVSPDTESFNVQQTEV